MVRRKTVPTLGSVYIGGLRREAESWWRHRTAEWSVVGSCFGALLLGCFGSAAASSMCPNEVLRGGAAAALPDCRAYEQVSPVEKGGFAAFTLGGGFPLPVQASPDGQRLAYMGRESFPGAEASTATVAGHVAVRSGTGWQTEEITPAMPETSLVTPYVVSYVFSPDLSQAVVQTPLTLTPGATAHLLNLYEREVGVFHAPSYTLLNSAPPPVPPEVVCPSPKELETCFQVADLSAFAGASPDFRHVLFEFKTELFNPEEQLYESFAGKVSQVGVLPDGKVSPVSTAGSGSSALYTPGALFFDKRVMHAMSEDGSHVIFQAPADGGEPDPEQNGMTEVYDRIGGEETIELSAPAPGATPASNAAESAQFWAASADGTRVFFTSSAELTTESRTNSTAEPASEDLYEYNLEKLARKEDPLTDLTIDTNPIDASNGAEVMGVVGASADGSYVYFVAGGQLDEGEGVDKEPNLYVVHNGGKPVFIATLNGADSRDWTAFAARLGAYVTPGGTHVAFMSVNPLTGYNNSDQASGEPDSEVFEYSALSKALTCASCDPGGGRPFGEALIAGAMSFAAISSPFHQVRTVSENGSRVFFTSPPFASELAFSPSETATRKIYEHESDGEGGPDGCHRVAGCTYRLSSSENTEEEAVLDVSANGSDVFFVTSEALVASDRDKLPDVYDARVAGGFAPPSPSTACQSNCRASGPGLPTEANLLSSITGLSGNLSAHVGAAKASKPKRGKKARCLAAAKRIKNARARRRKLRRCARARSSSHSRRTGMQAADDLVSGHAGGSGRAAR